jgi:glucose-1-phosphatase
MVRSSMHSAAPGPAPCPQPPGENLRNYVFCRLNYTPSGEKVILPLNLPSGLLPVIMAGKSRTREGSALDKAAGEIKAIAFDLGNVLVKVDHGRFCRGLEAATGLSAGAIYRTVFETGLEAAYDKGRISSRDFYRAILASLGLDLPYPLFRRLWCEIFDPMEDMESVAGQLAAAYPLFLLSNTNELHFNYIRERFPALLGHFGAFILSFELGRRKPEPEIYRELVRRAGLPPGHILYVDDKLPFVEAARATGLQSWQFTSPAQFRRNLKESHLFS